MTEPKKLVPYVGSERRGPYPRLNGAEKKEDAEILVQRIVHYWAERGYIVNCWVEPAPGHNKDVSRLYNIRSDMVNGWPIARMAGVL